MLFVKAVPIELSTPDPELIRAEEEGDASACLAHWHQRAESWKAQLESLPFRPSALNSAALHAAVASPAKHSTLGICMSSCR